MSHPDPEQHNDGASPSTLHRYARRDAEPFLAKHSLPDQPLPLPDLTPYLTALAAAETPAEVSAITDRLVGATAPLLDHIAGHFVATALWAGHEHSHTPQSVRLLRDAAHSVRSALIHVAQADLENLRAHYAPPALSPGEGHAVRPAAAHPSSPGPLAASSPPRSRR
ncbi:hypothetical protein NLX86_25885 [Streptomyces sp. A3M-1-3]|uniref:hypothetical protein n=1 Tax=Streptomyces sp. A3M-1-3 TaxID=2962044 RepID=UPI0020B748F7|nr:hypothetical protein [Streptomyces sp. A3M-1-3]MCP3821401.1 hypothetical protein [Streptomyces sp. A3M-1-3]